MSTQHQLFAGAELLALCVVSVGANARLSDAGLGCPGWPARYGHLMDVCAEPVETARAHQAFPGKQVEVHKARKEMAHRDLAGTLGPLILAIAGLAWWRATRSGWRPWIEILLLIVVVAQAPARMLTVRHALQTARVHGGFSC